MATSSIFENIKIDSPKFIEQYVRTMDASTGKSNLKKRSKATIVIADETESKRLRQLRKKKAIQ